MKIAIIGTGRVGAAVGMGWAKAGHSITFGVREPGSEKVTLVVASCGPLAKAASVPECAQGAEVVFLATPWLETEKVIEQLGDLTSKVVIDATNPIIMSAEEMGHGLLLGHTTSAGEEVAKIATGAKVVKAFNTTGSTNMADPVYGDRRANAFVASDHADAKEVASGLVRDLGMEPIDAGDLSSARYLEPMGFMWIKMALMLGRGTDFTFDVISR